MKMWHWKPARTFYERVERLGLHGLHFQHVALCERRAWLYLHHVNFAHWHNRVALGSVRHANAFKRDRSVLGLLGLAPDRVDWQNYVVHENKGTGGAVAAADSQTAFYALMLSIAMGIRWRAETHVLSTRRTRSVELDDQCLERMLTYLQRLETLSQQKQVPAAQRINLCQTCSAAVFCDFQ